MKKRMNSKRITAIAAALTLVVGGVAYNNGHKGIFGANGSGMVETFQYATTNDLGSFNSYAVVADTYHKNNHMEGTFATAYLESTGDACGITGNVVNYTNPDESIIYIGDVNDISKIGSGNGVVADTMILPEGTELDTNFNNGNGVALTYDGVTKTYNSYNEVGADNVTTADKSDYKIDFEKALASLNTYAAARLGENTEGDNTTVVKDGQDVDFNNRKITVNCGSGKNVINLTADEIKENKLYIEGPADGSAFSVVINVTGASDGDVYDKEISVNGDSSGYGVCGGLVMFNFGSQSGTFTFNKTNLGVVVAPNASVICTTTHNGSIFAKEVTNNGCEIHQNPFKQFETQEETTEETTEEVTEETTEETTQEVVIETESTTEETTEEITEEVTEESSEETTQDIIIETEESSEETTEEGTVEEATEKESEETTQTLVLETEEETEETVTISDEEETEDFDEEDVEEEDDDDDDEAVLGEERASEEDEDETETAEVKINKTVEVSSSTPQTGDSTNMPLMLSICLASLASVFGLKKIKRNI